MACSTVSNMEMTLPTLHPFFPGSSLPSPSPSPSSDNESVVTPSKCKSQPDQHYSPPRLPFPLSAPKKSHVNHSRRVSTCSMSSAPSLTYSPSPSPPPTRPASPESFLLVPCAFHIADAVVIVADILSTSRESPSGLVSSRSSANVLPDSPIFRPCKPSEARATLLIGPAISAHARKGAASGERRMHPYRIVRERRV